MILSVWVAVPFAGETPLLATHKQQGDKDPAVLQNNPSVGGQENIDPRQLASAIQRSARYLGQACDTEGKFVYRINLAPHVKVSPRYNILRHAGSIYAMAMYLDQHPDKRVQAAMIRAGRFLKSTAMGPVPDRPDLLAVWSEPQLNLSSQARQAKLGGTGLGLVALISIEKIAPGETSVAHLRKLGRFLCYMQKTNGSFYSKYIPAEGGRWEKWSSLYYPGEAALGLLMLYELDPSPRWLKAAVRALTYLARKRAAKTEVEADHWALLATAKLLSIDERSQKPYWRKQILNHAIQISNSILSQADRLMTASSAQGCFTGDGRTTPTATRIEGLLAALSFLPPEQEQLHRRINEHVSQGMHFLMNTQVLAGRFSGAIPRAAHPLPESHPGVSQSLNRRVTEVRIDYVQHTLSAMIQYQRLFLGAAKS